MEHQGHNVFNKPEEPLQKTPTPYEEACERPAKVRTASAKNPPKMMAVLKETERSLVALHDARSSPDVFWWEGDILVPASYNISEYLMVEDTCFPPSYTPIDMQARLVDWGKFDTTRI